MKLASQQHRVLRASRISLAAAAIMIGLMLLLASCAAPAAAPPAPPAAAPTAAPAPAPAATAPPAPTPTRVAAPAPTAPAAPPASQPRRGGVLTYYTSIEPNVLDLHQAGSIFILGSAGPLYSSLLAEGDNLDLATGWKMSADGTTVTIDFRSGVKFHNGSPVTAEDVQYSLERYIFSKKGMTSAWAGFFDGVERVEVAGPNAVRLVQKRPRAANLGLLGLGFAAVIPKAVAEQDQQALAQRPISTGPFKFKAWNKGSSLEYERNPDYFKPGLPYLDSLRVLIVPDISTQVAGLRVGRFQMTEWAVNFFPDQINSLKQSVPGFGTFQYPCGCLGRVLWNTTKAPFDNVKVRQAIAKVIDGPLGRKLAYQGVGTNGGFMPPTSFWTLPKEEIEKNWPPSRGPTDAEIQAAKQLMKDAGYGDGLTVRFQQTTIPRYEEQRIAICGQLGKIGIKCDIALWQWPGEVLSRSRQGDFVVGDYPTLVPLDDPDIYYGQYTTGNPNNFGRFSDPVADDLFKKQTTTLDSQQRRAIVWQLERRFMETVPAVHHLHREFFHGWRPGVHGIVKPGKSAYGVTPTKLEGVWMEQ